MGKMHDLSPGSQTGWDSTTPTRLQILVCSDEICLTDMIRSNFAAQTRASVT
jgi:hypothetical protein